MATRFLEHFIYKTLSCWNGFAEMPVDQSQQPVALELDGLTYLDSDGAAVLCRMKREKNVCLEGLHIFIEKIVELTEECEKAASYLTKPERRVD